MIKKKKLKHQQTNKIRNLKENKPTRKQESQITLRTSSKWSYTLTNNWNLKNNFKNKKRRRQIRGEKDNDYKT